MRKVWVLGRPAAAGFCFFRRAPRASPTRAQRSRTHTRALARCPEGMWRGERAKSPAPPPHPLSESQNIMTSAATSPCRRSPTARRQTAARLAYDTCSDASCSRARSSRIGRATCTGWCACRRCLAGGENGGAAPRPRRRARLGAGGALAGKLAIVQSKAELALSSAGAPSAAASGGDGGSKRPAGEFAARTAAVHCAPVLFLCAPLVAGVDSVACFPANVARDGDGAAAAARRTALSERFRVLRSFDVSATGGARRARARCAAAWSAACSRGARSPSMRRSSSVRVRGASTTRLRRRPRRHRRGPPRRRRRRRPARRRRSVSSALGSLARLRVDDETRSHGRTSFQPRCRIQSADVSMIYETERPDVVRNVAQRVTAGQNHVWPPVALGCAHVAKPRTSEPPARPSRRLGPLGRFPIRGCSYRKCIGGHRCFSLPSRPKELQNGYNFTLGGP